MPSKTATPATEVAAQSRLQLNKDRATVIAIEASNIDLRSIPKAQRDLARSLKEDSAALVSALAEYSL